MKRFQHLIESIKRSDNFLLTAHVNPDGDNIGSLLGLYYLLQPYGQQIDIILADPVPDYLTFLPGSKEIEVYSAVADQVEASDYDLAFILDSGDLERIGAVSKLLADDVKLINIDHHGTSQEFGDYNFVDSQAAATGELIYNLAVELGTDLTEEFGTAIATSIITDTGNFRFSNTTADVHRIIADMLELGVDTERIIKEIYEQEGVSSLRLKGRIFSRFKLASQRQVAWASVRESDLEELDATWEDTEGLVNYLRQVEDVEVGLLFKEVAAERTRVSLRSNDYFPVNTLARQLGGGGHARAAGCTIESDLATAQQKVLAKLDEELRAYGEQE
ncbi:MAG: DHH family phosphoesterase [Bacillota bacterium]